MTLNDIYRKQGEIVLRKIADETLLVPIRGNLADLQEIFALNSVGEYIWEHLDGENPLRIIRDGLVAAFDVEPAMAETDLMEFIGQLCSAGLIAPKA